MRLCREIRSIDKDIEEMALIIEGVWNKTEVQVRLLKGFWNMPSLLQPSLREHYADSISRLNEKLLGAIDGLEKSHHQKLSSNSSYSKAKALFLTKDLKKVVADLEAWQRRFDPSWYLITLLSASAIDEKLQDERRSPSARRIIQTREIIRNVSTQRSHSDGTIFRPTESISNDREKIPGTNTYTSSYDGRQILLDRTNYAPKANLETTKSNVRDLARMLRNVDPDSFGLLKCVGAVEIPPQDSTGTPQSQNTQFEFIFEIPNGLNSPKTLREILLSRPRISLTKRMKLAKQLARSIMFVHTTGFVHKGIRPETVLIFEEDNTDIGPSFLIGFERIRRAQGQTDLMGDLEWEKNLYRHPYRQGQWSEEAFKMQHDIYSLGVCLLEIALWHSFLVQEPDNTEPHPWDELNIQSAISDRNSRRGGTAIKAELVAITEDRLPSLVGDQYTNLVLACLCCLDTESKHNVFEGPGSAVKDEDGIVVGVRYIENVRRMRITLVSTQY